MRHAIVALSLLSLLAVALAATSFGRVDGDGIRIIISLFIIFSVKRPSLDAWQVFHTFDKPPDFLLPSVLQLACSIWPFYHKVLWLKIVFSLLSMPSHALPCLPRPTSIPPFPRAPSLASPQLFPFLPFCHSYLPIYSFPWCVLRLVVFVRISSSFSLSLPRRGSFKKIFQYLFTSNNNL